MKALIMGGGMSGLATAINLLDLGFEVELIEADEFFGGRASSWLDEDGDMIDNALHVFFPYYVNLMSFFKKMGIADNILWKSTDFYYQQEGGRQAVLSFPNLPAPLHALVAYLTLMKNYSAVPKWKMLLAALAAARSTTLYSEARLDALDEISFGMWAMANAPRDAFKFMEPGINGLTFTPGWGVSAKVMTNWFKKVSAGPETARVGFANGGLGEIWVGTCLDYIREKGGTCTPGQRVTSIDIQDNRITGITVNGKEKKQADLYISAMGPFQLRNLLPGEAFRFEYFQDLWHFQYSPSLSIQIWFDRKLTDVDVTFFSNDCIFNTYADLSNVLPHIFKGGTMFEMVLSPADHIEGLPDEVIFDKCISDLKRLFPEARQAEVKKYKVVRARQGVYRPYPGMEAHRPYQRSPYENFYLTGDYTKTHVSSGGMEAAIWNANKTTEVISQDKLGRVITLNEEFDPPKGLTAFIKPAVYGGAALGALCAVRAALRALFGRR